MDCLDNDCSGLELVPSVSAGGGGPGDDRIRALENFIETHSRDALPEEVMYAMFEFLENRWKGLVRFCLAHLSEKNVALALVIASEEVITKNAYGDEVAERFREMLAEEMATFHFKYVHANVHARLHKVIGVQAPLYRQEERPVTTPAPQRLVGFPVRDSKTQAQPFSQGRTVFQSSVPKPKTQAQLFSQGRTVFQSSVPKPKTKAQEYALNHCGSMGTGQEYPREEYSNDFNTPPAKARATYSPQSGGWESGGGRGSGTEVALRGSGLQMERRSNPNNTVELQKIAQQVLGPFMEQVFQAVQIQGSRLDAVEDNAAMSEAKIASLHTELKQTRADNACEFAKSRAESAAQSAAQHKQLMESLGISSSAAPVPSSFTQPPQRPLGGAGFAGAGAGAGFPTRGAGAGAGIMFPTKRDGAGAAVPSGGGSSVFPTKGPSGGGPSVFPTKGDGAGAGFDAHADMCHMHTLMNQGLDTIIGLKRVLVESTRVTNHYDSGGAEHASLIALAAKHTKAQGAAVFTRALYAQIRVVFPAFDPEDFLPPNAKDFSSMYDTKKRKADEIPDEDASDDGGSGVGHFENPLPDPHSVNFSAVPAAAGGGPPADDAERAAVEALKASSGTGFVPGAGAK